MTETEAAIIEAIADLTRRVDMLAAKIFRLEMRDIDE